MHVHYVPWSWPPSSPLPLPSDPTQDYHPFHVVLRGGVEETQVPISVASWSVDQSGLKILTITAVGSGVRWPGHLQVTAIYSFPLALIFFYPLFLGVPWVLCVRGMEMPHLGLSIRLYWEVTPRATDVSHVFYHWPVCTSLGQLFSF